MSSVTLDKCKAFALRIIRLYKFLTEEKNEFVLSKQILISGTSIGASLIEAQYSIRKREFNSKVKASCKECGLTLYLLELLFKSDYLTVGQYSSINSDCVELMRLLTSISYDDCP